MRQRQIVAQLRRARQQLDRTPPVFQPVAPLGLRLVHDGAHTVGIGAPAALCEGEIREPLGQIQPAEFEQVFRGERKDLGRTRSHSQAGSVPVVR